MKRILFSVLIVSLLVLTGCGKDNKNEIKRNVLNDIDKIKGYYQELEMEIVNNDDVYQYDVSVSYYKPDYYKVVLENKANGYEQTIVKNKDGVYVVTPTLNKSFKFQSEWPYNNSQAYLLNSIRNEIDKDKNIEIVKSGDDYIFVTKNINYPNNPRLVKEKITVGKDNNIKEVIVMDENNTALITVKYGKIDKSAEFDKDYFVVKDEKDSNNKTAMSEVPSLDTAIFPLYLPTGTVLANQEVINKDNGERIIMTFSGDKPFLLVEETANIYDEFTIIPTSGEPFLLIDTIASLTNESITWTSGGIDYYIVSDVLSQKELIEVAQSISTIPVMK
jgi:outer membrane lipoprotein-sorting protein